MAGIYRTDDLEQMVFSGEDGESAGIGTDEEQEDEALRTFLKEELAAGVPESFPTLELELTLEDGRTLLCEAAGIFLANEEKQYMALHPKEDTEGLIHILEMAEGEDDALLLLPIEDEGEREEAEQTFYRLFVEDGA